MGAITVGRHLSVEDALAGARAPHKIRFAPGAQEAIKASARRIREAVDEGAWIYGVNTGFGSNADHPISAADASALQANLLRSHAFGDGPPFEDEVVRLALLLRIHALSQGFSGIRPSTLRALIRLYEQDILPVVPCRGSVGASGDLAPLAYLALPLIGEGRVRRAGRETTAKRALAQAGLSTVELSFKEGLALVNGMQVTLAVALLALEAVETTLLCADACASLATEALAGRSEAFDARIHAARGHPGQQASAARIRSVIKGSKLVDAPHGTIEGKRRAPQDAYGIRCAPQVHGAVADGVAYVRSVLAREIDAATDNPLVFGKDVVSGGNFHGEPLGLAADHLRLCVHELGSISERRIATLVDPHLNEGLPAYLAPSTGLQSGFMIPQYVAAALVSETKTLAFPASADSIPTGANIEDHVSMATTAARRTREVVDLVQSVLAIELLTTAQAIDLRTLAPSPASRRLVDLVRTVVPFRAEDSVWKDSLSRVKALVRDGSVARCAGFVAGKKRKAR